MSEPKTDYWMSEAGTPPNVQPLVGRKVVEAYLLPSRRTILIIFGTPAEERTSLIAEGATTNGQFCLKIEVGDLKPSARFDTLPYLDPQPHLVGLEFTGIEHDVLVFGHEYGVQMSLGQVKWVKKA